MAMPAWQLEECAALEALFSPPVDALLRPWESPGDLLLALANKIAGSKGDYGNAEEPVLTATEKTAVTREIGAALTGALNAYFKARVPRAEAQHLRVFTEKSDGAAPPLASAAALLSRSGAFPSLAPTIVTDLRAFCFSWKPTAARTASFASDQATVSSVIFAQQSNRGAAATTFGRRA